MHIFAFFYEPEHTGELVLQTHIWWCDYVKKSRARQKVSERPLRASKQHNADYSLVSIKSEI